MQRATRNSLFSALLLSALAPLGAQNLAPTVGRLLRDRPGAVDPIAGIDRSLAFSRAVDVDLDLLARLDPAGGSVVDVELRPGLAFRAVFERRVPVEQGVVNWYGSLEGCDGSLFVLSIAEGAVAAGFMGVMPASALILSYLLLGEAFAWLHLAGFSIVFAGVLLMSWEHAAMADE